MDDENIHLLLGDKVKAVWTRSTDYRKMAIDGIKSKSDRLEVYDDDDTLMLSLSTVKPTPAVDPATGKTISSGDALHRARYKFKNFKVKPANKPYPNHAHHLIPARGFITLFTHEQKMVLYRVEYDVNNGNNLIFLPSHIDSCRYHYLPWHETNDGHSNYNTEVRESATTIEERLNEIIKEENECTEDDNLPKDLPQKLEDLENKLWNILVNAGITSINTITIPKDK